MFEAIRRGLRGLFEKKPDALERFAEVVDVHTDPEALFLYAGAQARFGDSVRALERLRRAVVGGYAVPQALREHPWLEAIRGSDAFDALVRHAEAQHQEALEAFASAGGARLLGTTT